MHSNEKALPGIGVVIKSEHSTIYRLCLTQRDIMRIRRLILGIEDRPRIPNRPQRIRVGLPSGRATRRHFVRHRHVTDHHALRAVPGETR